MVVVVVVPSVILRQCTQIESAKIQGLGVNTQLQEKKSSVQRGFVCCHLICILCFSLNSESFFKLGIKQGVKCRFPHL